MHYIVQFHNKVGMNESKQFDLLQDALTKGMKAVAYADAEIVLSIKQKIMQGSEESGSFCSWCGTVQVVPDTPAVSVLSFYRKLREDTITEFVWSPNELARIKEVLEAYPKPFSVIEECVALVQKFEHAQRVSPEQPSRYEEARPARAEKAR